MIKNFTIKEPTRYWSFTILKGFINKDYAALS